MNVLHVTADYWRLTAEQETGDNGFLFSLTLQGIESVYRR